MEKSDRERQMPCGLTYTRHLKNKTNKPTKRNRLIDTENEPVIARWGRSGAWEKGGAMKKDQPVVAKWSRGGGVQPWEGGR